MIKKRSTVDDGSAKDEFLVEIGKRVKEARNAAHLTQRQVGDAAGLTSTYVYLIEGGVQNISVVVLKRIADALGVTFGALLPVPAQSVSLTDNTLRNLASVATSIAEAMAIRRVEDDDFSKQTKLLAILAQQLIDIGSHKAQEMAESEDSGEEDLRSK